MTLSRRRGGASDLSARHEYSREIRARAAEEFARLPDGSAVAEMPSDYAVMREQARVRL